MAFLRNLLATIMGLFIFSLLSVFILVGIVSSLENDEIPTVKDESVLYLDLSGVLHERVIEDPIQELFPNAGPRATGLHDLLKSIKSAKSDSKIKGILMEHQYMSAGFASMQEVRDALIDFKESGKFIYSYAEYLSEGDYYLASVADQFYLHPEGSLEFNGLSVNITFWKGLFDKLEIKPEIFRVGSFKSYVEPFIRKDMSPQNRLQYKELLNSLYDTYLTNVAVSRGIEKVDLSTYSSKMQVQLPEDAVKLGLVDQLGYKDEIKELIMKQLVLEEAKDINFISSKNYAKTVNSAYAKKKIAVIVADGGIVMSGEESQVVGERFAREIRNARENSSVKAIVLRVNSPGGSLVASDLIWREIKRTKGVKPIIASMSDVAASGGYYIAMQCDTIIAQPNTITGSIGIFGMWYNLENFLENKLGITHDVVKTGEHSDIMTVTRQLSDYERQIIQKGVEKGYKTFITKAAAGRGVTPEAINKVGGGRVWTGIQAKEVGLVDILGSFDDAIKLAADMANLKDKYRVSFYPKQKPFLEQLMSGFSREVKSYIFAPNVLSPYVEEIKELTNMRGIQARMPETLTIH